MRVCWCGEPLGHLGRPCPKKPVALTQGHIERESRALAACEGKEFWENVSPSDKARLRVEAQEIAEAVRR